MVGLTSLDIFILDVVSPKISLWIDHYMTLGAGIPMILKLFARTWRVAEVILRRNLRVFSSA